jgi:hypothetical protein
MLFRSASESCTVRKWIAALSRRYGKADFIQPRFSKLKVPGYETVDSVILLPLPEYTLDDKKSVICARLDLI